MYLKTVMVYILSFLILPLTVFLAFVFNIFAVLKTTENFNIKTEIRRQGEKFST